MQIRHSVNKSGQSSSPFRSTYVVDAINKGIVAAIAHGQPVAAEPDDADEMVVVDFRNRHIQNIIELQRQPAQAEDNDHDNQHFYDLRSGARKEIKRRPDFSPSPSRTHLLLVFQQCYVPWILGIARSTGAPQAHRHLDVDKADDTEGNQILHKDQRVSERLQLIIR